MADIVAEPHYLHLAPEQPLPALSFGSFRVIIIAEEAVSASWRQQVAEWLVQGGCLYVLAWGVACQAWHGMADWAILGAFGYGEIPDDHLVMTTDHAEESLSEALWFAGNCASHPVVELRETLILHVARHARPEEMLQAYRDSQTMDEEDGAAEG